MLDVGIVFLFFKNFWKLKCCGKDKVMVIFLSIVQIKIQILIKISEDWFFIFRFLVMVFCVCFFQVCLFLFFLICIIYFVFVQKISFFKVCECVSVSLVVVQCQVVCMCLFCVCIVQLCFRKVCRNFISIVFLVSLVVRSFVGQGVCLESVDEFRACELME